MSFMYSKTKLAEITALRAGGKINRMNEAELRVYGQALDSFVEKFPLMESNMKVSLQKNDLEALEKQLSDTCGLLRTINADALALKALDQIAVMKGSDRMEVEARLTAFFADITGLSIDIQVAVYENPAKYSPEVVKAGQNAPTLLSPRPADEVSDGQKTVLAVDDVAFFLQSLKTHLQGMPFKLVCVTSGDDALRFINNKSPDLYILDIEMPSMNGYELAKEIRRRGKSAPIIFLTGNANREYVLKALEVGATDFIVKPIDKEQVVTRIGRALGVAVPGK
jgi:CheY-like chemotaxis protein